MKYLNSKKEKKNLNSLLWSYIFEFNTTLCCFSTFRVCLFGGEIGRMKFFWKKIGEKMNLCVVWLGGLRRGKKTFVWGLGIFDPSHKNFSLQNEEKIGRKRWDLLCDKNTLTFYCSHLPLSLSHILLPINLIASSSLSLSNMNSRFSFSFSFFRLA